MHTNVHNNHVCTHAFISKCQITGDSLLSQLYVMINLFSKIKHQDLFRELIIQ